MTYRGILDPNYTLLKTIFVSPAGSDSFDGSTEAKARLLSSTTLAMGGAGVGICALDGTYVIGGQNGIIKNGGNADSLTGYFVIFAKNRGAAKFVPDPNNTTFNLLDITQGASYIVLDGLDIKGPLPNLHGGSAVEIKNGHHYKVINCALHDAAACGLQAATMDYLLLQDCSIYGNAGTGNGTIQGGGYSGVSLAIPQAHDTLSGYHFVVRRNNIYNNMEGPLITVPHSDGNGLVFDTWNKNGYSQAVLVEDNVVTGNGARGIEILNAYAGGFTLRNNTCDKNGQDPTKYGTRGEIAIWNTPNTIVDNNIMVADPAFNSNNVALLIVNDSNSTGLFNNLTFNGTAGQASIQTVSTTTYPTAANGNLLGVDPQFVNPPADFHLLPSSLARSAGTLAYGYSNDDAAGNPRVTNGLINIGAYQEISVMTLPQTNAITSTFTTAPTAGRLAQIDTAVSLLIRGGLWPVHDVFYMRGADLQAMSINWKKPGTYTLTQVGTAAFVADGGVTSDHTTGYFTTGYSPSTAGGVAAQDSSNFGAWIGSNPTPASGQDITINGANFSLPCAQFTSRSTGSILRGNANNTTAFNLTAATITDSVGESCVNRTWPGTSNGYKNAAVTSVTDTNASTGIAAGSLYVCGTPMYGLSNKQLSAVYAGGGLTQAQICARYAVVWNYMNAVGGVGSAPAPTATSFFDLPLGAGGFITGMDIAPDGTQAIRTDTYGAYVRSSGAAPWHQVVTMQPMPAGSGGIDLEAGVFEIRIAPNNSSRMYMLFGGTSLVQCYRTDNKGLTWALLSSLPADATADANDTGTRTAGPRMAIDPQNSSHVWIGEPANGVRFTTDAGVTWTTISTTQIPVGATGYLVAIDPKSAVVGGKKQGIYVTSDGHGVYHSTNGGTSFALIAGSPTTYTQMLVDPNGILWYLDANPSINLGNFWKYSGSGSWPAASLSWAGAPGGLNGFAIDPANVGATTTHVYVTDDSGNFWRSLDSGATGIALNLRNAHTSNIGWLAWYSNANSGILSTSAGMCFDPSQTNTLYLPTGLGVWKTNPPTTNVAYTVSDDSLGIEQLNVNRIICPPFTVAGGGKPCVAVWDQGCIRADPASPGYPASHGTEPVFSAGWDCDYASSDPKTIVTLNMWAGNDDSGLSSDGGKTWAKFTTPPSGALGANFFAQGGQIAASSATSIVAVGTDNGTGPNKMVYTANGGTTWSPVAYSGTAPNASGVTGWGAAYYFWRHTLIADRVTAGAYYALNDGSGVALAAGIWKSTNGGANWSNYKSGLIAASSYGNDQMRSVFGVAGKFYYSNGKMAGGGDHADGGLWRCTDSGSALTVTKLANVGEVLSFGFGKAKPGGSGAPTIFINGWVSHVHGLYRSDDDGANWIKVGDWPRGSFDNMIAVDGDPNVFGQFYVGGHGGGAYVGSIGVPQ